MEPTPQETEIKKTEVPEKKELIVQINGLGAFEFSNQLELANAARLAIQMRLAPDHLKAEGLEAVMSALTICKTFKLPTSCMDDMFYIGGRIAVYGKLFCALAQRNKNFGQIKEFWIDEEYQPICVANKNFGKEWAAVVSVQRKDAETWNEYHFTIDDAKKAGLFPSTRNGSPWNKYTKDMLMHKSRARGYRANYAESITGIDYYEDVAEAFAQARDVTGSGESNLSQAIKEGAI